MNATAIPNTFAPIYVVKMDGMWIMGIQSDGTFDGYKALPNAMNYDGKVLVKRSWNSDSHEVTYKEGKPSYSVA